MINSSQPVRHLLIVEDKKYRQTISLQKETYSIGRHPQSSIIINSHQASRHHATFMRRKSSKNNDYSYWIIDGDLDGNKSRNGIYINGKKCSVKELKNGDLVNFGCDVNATYYAISDWFDTVIDLDSLKAGSSAENSSLDDIATKTHTLTSSIAEPHNALMLSELYQNVNYSNTLNPKDTLQAQEYQDPLTNLPNRLLFQEYLSIAITNANQYRSLMAVILLDINHFKAVNENWGYPIGDQVLKEVAERLHSSLRSSDIVARWGDDKFMILLPKISSVEDIEKITQRLLNSVSQSFVLSGHELTLEYTLGVATYPQEGQDVPTLLKKAETALLKNKKQTLSPDQPSGSVNDAKSSKLLKAKTVLQQALNQHELMLYYQPQIRVETGEVSGMEALVRWDHPQLGQISPHKFIPLAEQTDLMVTMGEWILKAACHQNKVWQNMGLPPFPISVNISPQQLEHPNFRQMLEQVLKETKLNPNWLELEITEKAILPDLEAAHRILQKIRQLGVHLSMDDFGTGYSCINHLPQLPFGTLKIAQSCVKDMTKAPENVAVIAAAIALGKSLDLRIVAEGVETQEQLELLRNLNCQEMQGYLLSQPLTEEEATKFLSMYHNQTVSLS